MSTRAPKTGRKQKLQIFLLIGALLIFAYLWQTFGGWHRELVLSEIQPEIVQGQVAHVSLLPSNTGTSYAVGVELESGHNATLIASLELAQSCEIGEIIKVEKRGLDYRFSDERCGHD